jgi:hypothetical protein
MSMPCFWHEPFDDASDPASKRGDKPAVMAEKIAMHERRR